MRDILVHDYLKLDISILWRTATYNVPALAATVILMLDPALNHQAVDDEIRQPVVMYQVMAAEKVPPGPPAQDTADCQVTKKSKETTSMSVMTETAARLGLKDAELLRGRCYVDGQWIDADSGKTIDVTNPADGSKLGTVPAAGEAETRRAIEAANRAYPAWRAKTAKERAKILRTWFDLMMANQEDLARIMTAEQGKPIAESRGEIAYAASFIEWFGEEAKRVYGDTIPAHLPGRRIVVTKEPVGVCAAITPWNFPAAMITRKAGPALAAGCPIVIKPATSTPYSAFAMAVLAERAGVPAGVLSVLTGSAKAIGGEMTSNPLVRKLTFTGSTEIGKQLMSQCAGTVKKVSLELGGNAPFIVFDDADLDEAVKGAIASKYRNTGQTCVCANRLLVQNGIYDAFAAKLAEAVKALKVADGMTEGAQQGPLIDMSADREGRGPYPRRPVQGCPHRRRRRAPFARRDLLPADRSGRCHDRDEGDAGRNLRPGRPAVPLRHGRAGHQDGQRYRIRSGRLLLQPRYRPGLASRGGAGIWHRRYQ